MKLWTHKYVAKQNDFVIPTMGYIYIIPTNYPITRGVYSQKSMVNFS